MSIKLDACLTEGKKILCAVSGGADSVCLLHLLWSSGADVTAAHFEHGIRGEESLRDAEFVRSFCHERGIEFVMESADVPAYAKAHSMGTEEAARKLRYEFLNAAAEQKGCELIATAHNADDNAETMLFNLTRGTGSAGLSGIPRQRGKIIRPLLNVTRRQIEEYLEENKLPHIEDSSNSTDDYSRNLIRHHVTPVLRKINPELATAFSRTAKLMAQDNDCLERLAQDFIAREYDGSGIRTGALCALHPAIASRVLRNLLGGGMGMEHIDSVLDFAAGTGLAHLSLPGITLRREQGRLFFSKEETFEIPPRRLTVGCRTEIPELGVSIMPEFTVYSGEIYGLFKTYCIKCENIKGEISCSGRRPGDAFRPISRNCTKKLKTLFAEHGYTQAQRDRTLVIRDDEGILLAVGLAAAQRTKPDIGDRVLKITIEIINQG